MEVIARSGGAAMARVSDGPGRALARGADWDEALNAAHAAAPVPVVAAKGVDVAPRRGEPDGAAALLGQREPWAAEAVPVPLRLKAAARGEPAREVAATASTKHEVTPQSAPPPNVAPEIVLSATISLQTTWRQNVPLAQAPVVSADGAGGKAGTEATVAPSRNAGVAPMAPILDRAVPAIATAATVRAPAEADAAGPVRTLNQQRPAGVASAEIVAAQISSEVPNVPMTTAGAGARDAGADAARQPVPRAVPAAPAGRQGRPFGLVTETEQTAGVARHFDPDHLSVAPAPAVPAAAAHAPSVAVAAAGIAMPAASGMAAPVRETIAPVGRGAPVQANVAATPAALAAAITAMHRNGQPSAVLRLDPPDLGALSVHVAVGHDSRINVLFIPAAPQTAQILNQGLDGLRVALAASGFSLGQSDVAGDGRGGGQSYQAATDRAGASAATAPPAAEPADPGVRAYA